MNHLKPSELQVSRRMAGDGLVTPDILRRLAAFDVDASENVREAQNWADFYREALDQAAIVAVTDPQGRIVSVNRKFCELSGYSEAELIGSNHRLLRSGVHDPAFFRDLYRTIARGGIWHGEICNRAKSGELYWVDTTIVPHRDCNGRVQSYTAIRFDITPQKRAEGRLWKLANIDALTGLPNRLKFMGDLREAISSAGGSSLVVGLVDIDHFKDINDSLGHQAGDEVLKEIAQRIRAALGPFDLLARLGGDEFALILRDSPDLADSESRVAHIYDALDPPMLIGGDQRKLHASIGLTRFPHGGKTGSELLKHADIALYAAKAKGRDCAAYFSDEMRDRVQRRSELLNSFERALSRGEFCVHYQPVTPLRGGAPIKVEALLRWNHPVRGLLSPGCFTEALADEGLAARADSEVLGIVLADIDRWRKNGVRVESVAVNVTAGDFSNPRYVDRIMAAIADGRIGAKDICVEITEGILLGHNGSKARCAIERLHSNGVPVAFDDFGTGFASLSHLRDLPVDFVKIDQSFIISLATDQADRAIVESVIRLVHHLGKAVIAEGVETVEQVEILDGLGCDYVQGHLRSKPVSADMLPAVIDRLGRLGDPEQDMAA